MLGVKMLGTDSCTVAGQLRTASVPGTGPPGDTHWRPLSEMVRRAEVDVNVCAFMQCRDAAGVDFLAQITGPSSVTLGQQRPK